MTPPERRLWAALRRNRLGVHFKRQQPVGPYFADFICQSHHLIIEIDGKTHDFTVEHDQRRADWLESCGYHTLRFSNEHIRDHGPEVVNIIEDWLNNHPPDK